MEHINLVEERVALAYLRHAYDALEVLVGREYDDVAPSMRIRAFLGKDAQVRKIETQFIGDYRNTLMHLHEHYHNHVEIAIHGLVEQTKQSIDNKLDDAISTVQERFNSFALAA